MPSSSMSKRTRTNAFGCLMSLHSIIKGQAGHMNGFQPTSEKMVEVKLEAMIPWGLLTSWKLSLMQLSTLGSQTAMCLQAAVCQGKGMAIIAKFEAKVIMEDKSLPSTSKRIRANGFGCLLSLHSIMKVELATWISTSN